MTSDDNEIIEDTPVEKVLLPELYEDQMDDWHTATLGSLNTVFGMAQNTVARLKHRLNEMYLESIDQQAEIDILRNQRNTLQKQLAEAHSDLTAMGELDDEMQQKLARLEQRNRELMEFLSCARRKDAKTQTEPTRRSKRTRTGRAELD